MTNNISTAEVFNIQNADELTWNVMPLMHEVKHALTNLISNNETAIIDLRSIPLAPGEEDKLLDILGIGEVQARLNSLGPSDIIETKYSGVWLITHYNDENNIISRFIEITTMPEILFSQKDDMHEACENLTEALEDNQQAHGASAEKTE